MVTKKKKAICTAYQSYCETHGAIHGGEAEELRVGIERILQKLKAEAPDRCCHANDETDNVVYSLESLLDKTDARDSAAFLERDSTKATAVTAKKNKRR